MRPFLDHISRGQIHSDTLWWQGQPDRTKGSAYTFTRLGNSLVSKSNNCHRRQPVGDMNLHLYRDRVDTTKSDSGDCGMHNLLALSEWTGHDVGNMPVPQVS